MLFRLLGLAVGCDRPLPATALHDDRGADVVVERELGPLPTPPELRIGSGDWPRTGRAGGVATLWFDDDAVFTLDPRRGSIRYHLLSDLDSQTFSHELIDAVLPRYLALRGDLVLHASSIVGAAGVVALVGRSGAGKSTLAASLASRGRQILGDDVAVIVEVAGVDHVVPSGTSLRLYQDAAEAILGPATVLGPPMAYWSSKRLVVPADNALLMAELPVPLCAVVELVDGDSAPALARLDGGATFELLARNCFDLPDDDPAAGMTLLERWAPLAGRLEAYRLWRRMDFGDLTAVGEALRPLLDGEP